MQREQFSTEMKAQIAGDLREYVKNVAGSNNKASKMLDVSNSYIGNMVNGLAWLEQNDGEPPMWAMMSDDTWRKVQKQVSNSDEWKLVETSNYKLLMNFFTNARNHANVFGIVGNPGHGKTSTAKADNRNPNTFLICCNEYDTRKSFLTEMLNQLGREDTTYSLHGMMETIIEAILRMDRPVIKIDEADKLSDPVLYFFITLYNRLEDKCGLVITGAPYLEKRIVEGAKRNKKGYKEFLSRLGGKFIQLPKTTEADVELVVRTNGVSDALSISRIVNESDGDLRRVKRLVHAEKMKIMEEAA